MPGVVACEMLLGLSDRIAVQLGPLAVWPQGVRLSLWLTARKPPFLTDPFRGRDPLRGPQFGVEFPDGRRAIYRPRTLHTVVPGEGPVLWPLGGAGTGADMRWELYLWPLPAAGEMTLACRWDDQGVDETLNKIDTKPLLEAARRARPL